MKSEAVATATIIDKSGTGWKRVSKKYYVQLRESSGKAGKWKTSRTKSWTLVDDMDLDAVTEQVWKALVPYMTSKEVVKHPSVKVVIQFRESDYSPKEFLEEHTVSRTSTRSTAKSLMPGIDLDEAWKLLQPVLKPYLAESRS